MTARRGVLSLAPASPRRRLASVALLLVVCAALAWLTFHHPRDAPVPMRCPSLALLGVHCPGCGSTRATHFVLQGKWGEAWRHNPALVLLGIPVGCWFVASTAFAAIFGRRVIVHLNPALGWVLLTLLIVYMIARNVPAAAFDWLRPPMSTLGNQDGHDSGEKQRSDRTEPDADPRAHASALARVCTNTAKRHDPGEDRERTGWQQNH